MEGEGPGRQEGLGEPLLCKTGRGRGGQRLTPLPRSWDEHGCPSPHLLVGGELGKDPKPRVMVG